MKKILFIIPAFALLTCVSIQKKPEKQLDENKKTLEIINEARNGLKVLDVTPGDKAKIFEALGKSEQSINESQKVIADYVEFKSLAIAKNAAHKATIKKQNKVIFWLIVPYVILILYFAFKLIYRFTPMGAAMAQLKNEIKAIRDNAIHPN